jgi:transposase
MEVNMDTRKDQYVNFFLNPAMPKHRQYEVLRAYYLEKRPAGQVAEQFDITESTIYGLVGRFKDAVDSGDPIAFFVESKTGPKKEREKAVVREKVILLRVQGYADTDIHKALKKAQIKASVALIDQIIRDEGLGSIRKRTQQDRERIKAQIESGHIPGLDLSDNALAELPVQADVNELDMEEEHILFSRVAGIFLFIPFLVELGMNKVVQNAEMIGLYKMPR